MPILSYELDNLNIEINIGILYIKVITIRVHYFQSGEFYECHRHSHHEFHYISKGKAKIVLDNKQYDIGPAEFYLNAPGQYHAQIADQADPMVEYGLNCEIKILDCVHLNEESTAKDEMRVLTNILKNPKQKPMPDINGAIAVFDKILDELNKKMVGYFLNIHTLILQFIILTARNLSENLKKASYDVPKKKKSFSMMSQIIRLIDDNYNTNLKASDIAKHCFLSEKQINRIMKENVGTTINEYITQIRIKNAKKFLVETEYTLSQIAELIGFSNQYYLCRTFKKIEKITPTCFRKMHKTN